MGAAGIAQPSKQEAWTQHICVKEYILGYLYTNITAFL